MKRTWTLVAALVIVLTACGSSGAPDGYSEQPVDFESVTGETVEVPLVEANYREACEKADPGSFDDADRVADYCKCTFDKYEDQVPFEVFEAFNSEIADKADEIDGEQALQRAYRIAVEKAEEDTPGLESPASILDLIAIPCT